MKISVIITVYNGEDYLQECLNSILNQSLYDIEVICVNDASNDTTGSILEEFMYRDHRIKVVTNITNYGAGASRNIGIKKAKGKYLIFLDADDLYEQNMLERAYLKAEYCNADICVFHEDQFDDRNGIKTKMPCIQSVMELLEERGNFSPKELKDVIFNLWNGWAWDKLFKKEFVLEKDLRFQEILTTNDAYFVHTAIVNASKIVYVNEILVHHRVNVMSSLSNSRDKSWECCYLYLKKLKDYLVKQELYEEYELSFINWSTNFLYWNYWSLSEKSREALFYALKRYMLNELELLRYSINEFYNPFYFWFIQSIYETDNYQDVKIPIRELDRWKYMILKNETKLQIVAEYLNKQQYCAAVWGAGERGKIFLDKFKTIGCIRKVYDRDIAKVGLRIGTDLVIEEFNKTTCSGIDIIFVTNTNFFYSIAQIAKSIRPELKVFNFAAYLDPELSFPVTFEECIV